MALHWNWSDKIGTVTIFNHDKEVEYTLYQGNAFLIMLYEYKDKDGEELWQMGSFFVDESHAKNCLGLTKGYDNMFNTNYYKMLKIRINKKKYSYTKKLIDMLVKAFDDISIELYTEKETA